MDAQHRSLRIRARDHTAAAALDEKTNDIGPHEALGKGAGLDLPDALVGQPVVGHAAQHHVDEGVDPERSEQDQQLADSHEHAGCLIVHAEDAKYEADALPCHGHDHHPAEGLAVPDGLGEVCDEEAGEEHGEDDGGGVGGAV